MFLPRGDVVRCVVYRSYLGKCNNSVVGGGVGVVKRRQVGGYRGASVTRELRDDLHRALRPPLGPPRPPLNAETRPMPRARIGARAFAIVESIGEVWMVFVLK